MHWVGERVAAPSGLPDYNVVPAQDWLVRLTTYLRDEEAAFPLHAGAVVDGFGALEEEPNTTMRVRVTFTP